MYLVNTIGSLGDATPEIPVMAPAPAETMSIGAVVGIALVGGMLGAAGMWALTRKKGRRS